MMAEDEAQGQHVTNLPRGAAWSPCNLIIGAHDDMAWGLLGTSDNALALFFTLQSLNRTLWFVAFTNEECPFLCRPTWAVASMHSTAWQPQSHLGLFSLETSGYCASWKGRQRLSFRELLAPQVGICIALIAHLRLRAVRRKGRNVSRRHTNIYGDTVAL
jgi:hypothetical protein